VKRSQKFVPDGIQKTLKGEVSRLQTADSAQWGV
jgi:hypothetical protein